MTFLFKSVVFIALTLSVHGEVYTAVTELKDALEVERLHIEGLKKFVDFAEKHVKYFKWQINEYTRKNNEARNDIDDYLANPLNVFMLVKRITSEWTEITEKILYANEILEHVSEAKENLKVPDFKDLQGVAAGIAKLQKLYNLKTGDMVDGIINGIETNLQMTAKDCYDLAVEMFNNKNYPESLLWLEEATELLDQEDMASKLNADIQTFIAMNHLEDGNLTFALEITNRILKQYPQHELATEAREEIENRKRDQKMDSEILTLTSPYKKTEDGTTNEPQSIEEIVNKYDENKFNLLCQNGTLLSPKKLAQLRCRYETNNSPFLKIAPIKVEEVSLNPYIVVFHGIIYDKEIDYIKDTAKPMFERSTTAGTIDEMDEGIVSNRRTSKSAFLEYNQITEKIFNRVSAVTGLSMKNCERLQVVNYGIGGHYVTHYDFFPPGYLIDGPELGNRISTLLIYMSEVKSGGATVFPYLDVAIQPVRGAAVFWYNIHESGELDFHTRHGACPVLYGNKWIANVWTRSFGQELRRLCGLKEIIPSQVFVPGIGWADV